MARTDDEGKGEDEDEDEEGDDATEGPPALREDRHERRAHRADENMRSSSLPPSTRAGQRVDESKVDPHGHGAKVRVLVGARATRVFPCPHPRHGTRSRIPRCAFGFLSFNCSHYAVLMLQAAQISTGTAELREITKMERIGTLQPHFPINLVNRC